MIVPDPTPGNLSLAEAGARFGFALFGRARFGDAGASGLGELPISPDGVAARFGYSRFGFGRFGGDWGLSVDTQPGGLTLTEDSHV